MSSWYDATTQRWLRADRYLHDGSAWVDFAYDHNDGPVRLDNFSDKNYLGKDTIMQYKISSSTPIDPNSDEMAKFMWEVSPFSNGGAWGVKTSLNTSAYGTKPVPMYVVDSSHPDTFWRSLEGTNIAGAGKYDQEIISQPAPMPSWGRPAVGGDAGLAVYDVATGLMRDFFGMWLTGPVDDTTPFAGGGGYSQNTPGLRNLAKENYGLQHWRGWATVSGMHNPLGFIGIQEAINRKINHTLCFTVAAARSWLPDNTGRQYISWPSRLSDGKLERFVPGDPRYNPNYLPGPNHDWIKPSITPTHGQLGWLPKSVDPMHNPRTGKPYAPFTRVLIEAAQEYGMRATDTNLWCHAFNAEDGRVWENVFGKDPWGPGGIITAQYAEETQALGLGYGASVHDFPWDLTVWAPVDYGRPSPDWWGHHGQRPWWRDDDPGKPSWYKQPSLGSFDMAPHWATGTTATIGEVTASSVLIDLNHDLPTTGKFQYRFGSGDSWKTTNWSSETTLHQTRGFEAHITISGLEPGKDYAAPELQIVNDHGESAILTAQAFRTSN